MSESNRIIRFAGEKAEIRWSYRLAARLGPWRCERTVLGGHFSADDVDMVDAFALTQSPLDVVIQTSLDRDAWVWPIQKVWIEGTQLYCDVGPIAGTEQS